MSTTITSERLESPLPYETMDVSAEELRWKVAREIGRRVLAESGREELPASERVLTEVDNLNRLRLPDGSHDPKTLRDTKDNLVPRVVEPSMPYAVSTTYQEYRNGEFYWLDQTSLQVAASGLRFHKHKSAQERVVVEVAEALDLKSGLKPDMVKVLPSPRMSPKDAPKEVAEAEHLADDDMIRIHWLDVDQAGSVRGKFMQSILVRDIPLKAWVDMLASPSNIFGKSVHVEDPESALSVMKTFYQLDLPASKLPEGVVTLLSELTRFIDDPDARRKVMQSLPHYRKNQQLMRQVANDVATRWLDFEVALADSVYKEEATPEIERFIHDLRGQWADEDLNTINKHRLSNGRYYMTRELAVCLEEAKQNILWVQAGVMVNNERVTKQMDVSTVAQIHSYVSSLHESLRHGASPQKLGELEGEAATLSASQNVTVGGGCPGKSKSKFRNSKDGSSSDGESEKTGDSQEESDEACDYEHTGCYCCPYNDDGTWRSKPLKVRAQRDKDGTARCLRSGCRAKLGSNGKAISKGDIYAKAMALKQQMFSRKQTAIGRVGLGSALQPR